MPSRKPATPQEVTAVLETETLRDNPLGEGRAVAWNTAITRVQYGLRTTRDRARQWLINTVTDPGSDLVAVWSDEVGQLMTPSGGSGSEYGYEPLSAHGWPANAARNLAFTTNAVCGVRVPAPQVFRVSTKSQRAASPWIVRRTDLDAMRAEIVEELAEAARQGREERAQEVAAFKALHGDALKVISALVKPIGDRVIHVSGYDGSELHGSAGALTITLYGDQIEAFADALQARADGAADA
jgi:hypothetical protein